MIRQIFVGFVQPLDFRGESFQLLVEGALRFFDFALGDAVAVAFVVRIQQDALELLDIAADCQLPNRRDFRRLRRSVFEREFS